MVFWSLKTPATAILKMAACYPYASSLSATDKASSYPVIPPSDIPHLSLFLYFHFFGPCGLTTFSSLSSTEHSAWRMGETQNKSRDMANF